MKCCCCNKEATLRIPKNGVDGGEGWWEVCGDEYCKYEAWTMVILEGDE